MAVGWRWTLRIVIGRARSSAGRQTLWSASGALLVVGLLFALNFVYFEVAQSWKLRSERQCS